MFRELPEGEVVEFKRWARENYQPYDDIKGVWHPVVQAECVEMNKEGK